MYQFNKIIRTSILGLYQINYKILPRLAWNQSFKNAQSKPVLFLQKLSGGGTSKFRSVPKHSAIALSILTWLGFTQEDEEEEESILIKTLKRSVLCMQREQHDKAEQMLHLALRIAQQQQNQQGILYCYDLMANLAFETLELDKAEKLFVSVLQMLLSQGMQDDNLKVIHISLKLARIKQLLADLENAQLGYDWCLQKIDKQKYDSDDAKLLYGIINDWYAQFLLDKGEIKKSLEYLKEAHKICQETKGKNCAESVLLLNDLGITSFRADDLDGALKYLKEAVDLGENLEDKSNLGIVQANLGLMLLEKGILVEAQKACQEALHLGQKHESTASVGQASYCFDQIRLHLNN